MDAAQELALERRHVETLKHQRNTLLGTLAHFEDRLLRIEARLGLTSTAAPELDTLMRDVIHDADPPRPRLRLMSGKFVGPEKLCVVCATPFEPHTFNQVACGPRCQRSRERLQERSRQRAARAKRREGRC